MGYASGKKAWGISDRSGRRYPLKKMRKEWNGSMVGPDEYEPKHPQLRPFRIPEDNMALRNARPDQAEPILIVVGDPNGIDDSVVFPRAVAKLGTVEVSTS